MTTAHSESPSTVTALVTRFFAEVLNAQDRAAAAELLAADFIVHHPAFPSGIVGIDAVLSMIHSFHAGFPDLQYHADEILADGDRAAVRWTATGTHDGEFLGIQPKHRSVTVAGVDVFHSANGRLTATWVNSDLFGLFQQLGAFPPI